MQTTIGISRRLRNERMPRAAVGFVLRGVGRVLRGVLRYRDSAIRRRLHAPAGLRRTMVSMRVRAFAFAFAAGLAAMPNMAGAADTKPALELKPKAALMAAVSNSSAPFVGPASGPELHFAPQRDNPPVQSRSSCNADRELCYDANSGHIVFKPARQFMPDLPGMTPENISVKKHRIILRYSF
jgi:hypothetical protein